jgi:hypothetical protein
MTRHGANHRGRSLIARPAPRPALANRS